MNQEETKKNSALALELIDALLMPPSVIRESVIVEVRSRMPSLEDGKADASNTTIRFDLCLAASFPADCPREL